ncbi:MAG TPA: dTDP-glucose 4,6-dehydratase [Deltaproteobacteria bacterium]|jgi:dTDP-glucose 4,6-dehydratase|nr:dTDP-glucose 4,6-dehydratase [Deltaproteobacteria bacterium]MDI9541478.1 dTDP-glucose 4,6-dehydratase [Pseudomonadota bacterium]NLW69439.1 dTDP-glucose 4,6-dehydratase [Bacteriovoracaceae bacterium]HRR20990.1 dTDP-glucose 4,6-dehydratase [Desulfomonilia bacterium]HNU74765.1 dTDP-glucose 4,6-dehydratase [Deltaproteobacteria bacterium]
MKVLVTGGCGFIGTNLLRHILENRPDWSVVNFDLLTYAGNLENTLGLQEAYPGRYEFVKGDIADRAGVDALFSRHSFDLVLNLAAESHVDRSIEDASVFMRTNVLGVQVLLDAARKYKVDRFLHVSTDEVYGSLGKEGRFREDLLLAPNSPYSASKAAADLLVRSYVKTYGLDAVITRCSNNYGPYQFPEKLIPLMIINAWNDRELPVYGDGRNVRDWIYVDDHCRGIVQVAENGRCGEVYNMGGDAEKENIQIVRIILSALDKPESLIRFVTDRPGHDFRYAMDFSKIAGEIGWKPEHEFEEGMEKTIQWYLGNKPWWERILSGTYQQYYERMYGNR